MVALQSRLSASTPLLRAIYRSGKLPEREEIRETPSETVCQCEEGKREISL
jgi:hypothetical protein